MSDLSCKEEDYENSKPLYEAALNESECKTTMTYTKTTTTSNRTEHALLYGLTYLIAKTLKQTSEKHSPS